MTAEGHQIMITIHLPQPLERMAIVLAELGRQWPGAVIDTSAPDGWRIDIPAER